MPELPDVEKIRSYLQHTVLQKTIDGVSVQEQEVLKGVSPQRLGKTLHKRTFGEALRHGKYCFLTTGEATLAFHFGMTGDMRYFKSPESKPDHICLSITFANSYTLVYTSARKLGEIEICKNPEQFVQDKELGPDALARDLDRRRFVTIFRGRRGLLKSALMNQHHLAGIGNVYSDEILFQEELHPRTALRRLNDNQLGRIFTTMRRVLRKSVAAGGNPDQLPDSYLTAHRHTDRKCPRCMQQLEKITVAGRSARFCRSCQANE